MNQKTAVIIGAGPAGLTSAYELIDRTDISPVVLEMTPDMGGISKTVNYKGNRIDIGGHRFFSKSDRVMNWWRNLFPVQGFPARDDILLGRKKQFPAECLHRPVRSKERLKIPAPDPEKQDVLMLLRDRFSRIYFNKKFFDYPVSLSMDTVFKMGFARTLAVGLSYLKSRAFPVKNEKSLEDFFINRFGRKLYETFFKDYTEKVWGIPCSRIKPEWGAQRVKGLSVSKAVMHAVKKAFDRGHSVSQKEVETSLIARFMYPKLGPGQLWEEAGRVIKENGGKILVEHKAEGIEISGKRVTAVIARNAKTRELVKISGDYFFSSMPVKDLIQAFGSGAPPDVRKTAEGLNYREFITTGLLLRKLNIKNETKIKTINGIIPDNWIYVQESGVKMGRIQIFNNWSPYMVKDPDTVWLGLEYFCATGDEMWRMTDKKMIEFAVEEACRIGMMKKEDFLDAAVIRMEKTYPVYSGSYENFGIIRDFTDGFENLFLIGRNGMHRYNNSDHSMLAAMTAVDNILAGETSKENIWNINTEEEYHEEK